MATKVTITLTVDKDLYSEYESALNDFENALPEIDIEVKEDDMERINDVVVYKQTTCEVDEDWFKNTIADDNTHSMTFDYKGLFLMENRPVFTYLKENYPKQLELLKNGDISYIEVAWF